MDRRGDAILKPNTALALDPSRAYAHAYLGLLYTAEHRFEEAAAEYRKIVIADDSFVPLAMAHLRASEGRRTEALRALRDVRPTQSSLFRNSLS